jgi:adenosylcobinamide-GDP ribazoletransferase
VLPVGGQEQAPARSLGRAFFPAVGLLLGLLGGAAFWLVSLVTTPLLAATAAVATLAVLTGGLHLDGLADAADGLFGAGSRERRLEIMRDPRVGAFGVVALVLVLIADVAALQALSRVTAMVALITAAALGRLAMVVLLVALPYVRQEGLGTAAVGAHGARDLALAAVTAALPLLLDWRHGVIALGLAALVTGGGALLARARLGGATGDVYGAVLEVTQLAALAGFAARL